MSESALVFCTVIWPACGLFGIFTSPYITAAVWLPYEMVTFFGVEFSTKPLGAVISLTEYVPNTSSLLSALPVLSVVMVSTSVPALSRTSNTAPARE